MQAAMHVNLRRLGYGFRTIIRESQITSPNYTIQMEKEKTLYLIDGTAYIYRAYHAIRGLSNSRGLPTNAIFG